jgi:transposase
MAIPYSLAEPFCMMRPDVGLPRVYLCVAPVDFRKSIDSSSLWVEQQVNLNLFEAVLLIFINRRCDKIEILYWEKTGFASRTSVWRSSDLNGLFRQQQHGSSMVNR